MTLSEFNIALSEGEAILTDESCPAVLNMAILMHSRSVKLAPWFELNPRTLNHYRNGRVPKLNIAVRMLNKMGYDVVIRKRK